MSRLPSWPEISDKENAAWRANGDPVIFATGGFPISLPYQGGNSLITGIWPGMETDHARTRCLYGPITRGSKDSAITRFLDPGLRDSEIPMRRYFEIPTCVDFAISIFRYPAPCVWYFVISLVRACGDVCSRDFEIYRAGR